YASDYYVIPTLLDKLSSYGLTSLKNKVNKLNSFFAKISEGYRPTELIGIVANNVREYGQEPIGTQTYTLGRLQDAFGDLVFQNYLIYGDGITKASELGNPVYSQAASGGTARKQADMAEAILYEMLERLRGWEYEGEFLVAEPS
ncbi:MAG: hypothetical protein PHZ03_10830, partial [Syntrophomonas sp.]|nr:hypothetical protein [Syntrophomonas sp.]